MNNGISPNSGLFSMLASFAMTVIPILFPQVKIPALVIKVIETIAPVIDKLLEKYLDKKMNISEAGDRVLQAQDAGIVPDKFEKFSDYTKEISNFVVDPSKSEGYTSEDKLLAGFSFATTLFSEMKNTSIENIQSAFSLVEKNPTYFTADRIDNMLNKSINMTSLEKYFSNELSMSKSADIGSLLVQAEKSLFPDKTETQIKQELAQLSTNQ